MSTPEVAYVYDPSVTEDLDWQLRVLLTACFPGPMFRHKRYNAELPAHRWIIRAEDGSLVAHVAAHDKHIRVGDQPLRVGGIAEVCVHPAYRGRKFVGLLLEAAHAWMRAEGIPFSILFGHEQVYRSKGYALVTAPCRMFNAGKAEWEITSPSHFLVRPIADATWPPGLVDLRCPAF
jgi:predicted N-acetyltransferase YhbS